MRRLGLIIAGLLILTGCSSNPDQPASHTHSDTPTPSSTNIDSAALADELALAREATGQYVTDLDRALADGYQGITPMMEDMGVHYVNPSITDFDPARPHILVYVPTDDGPQLGALELGLSGGAGRSAFPGR